MPPPYTPWRRHVMQAVMWLILGATVCLAALVGRQRRQSWTIDLAPPSVMGNLSVQLPAKWSSRNPPADDPTALWEMVESPTPAGRTLRIMRDRMDAPISPLQFLTNSYDLKLGDDPEGEFSTRAEPIALGNWPGVLVTSVEPLPPRYGEQAVKKDLIACATLPSRDVVIIHLGGLGPPDPSDAAVVKQIAATVQISGEPRLGNKGEAVTIAEGAQVTVPANFVAAAANDPNSLERVLYYQAPADPKSTELPPWVSIQVTRCLVPGLAKSTDRERALATISTLLLVHNPSWRDATIEPLEQPAQWRAQSPRKTESFGARAYVSADPSGWGLLAIFRSDPRGEELFDSAWRELAASAKFDGAENPLMLADEGATETARLRQITVEELIPDRHEQWWLWSDPTTKLGWTHYEWDIAAWGGKSETRFSRGGRFLRLQDVFSIENDQSQYRDDVNRSDTAIKPPNDSLRQTTELHGKQLSLTTTASRAGQLQQWKISPPQQYLPGALLPHLIGRLTESSPRAMLIRTDSFIGCEGIGPAEPLTLIVRRADSAVRQNQGEDTPVKCVSVEVNGSGKLSRWFFGDDGKLESVELAGGLRRLPTPREAMELDFPPDSALSPTSRPSR